MIDFLLDPWEFAFMQRALLAFMSRCVGMLCDRGFCRSARNGVHGGCRCPLITGGYVCRLFLWWKVFWGAFAWAGPASLAITFIKP
ncbi:MAG: hypothetical protein Ct9H300mP11_32220 [Chloroflexota bacterium]|nr:MAG: hypothetical protein Ct9H300mP11_32220 [Chloroflexota bacterium]